jgi:DNA helicase HerA-like ATPase
VPLNVVYLNALAGDDAKQFFVAALAAEVYRWMVTAGGGASGPRVLFYIDEARDYVPAGSRKPPAKEPLLRLFAQGRKYGVAGLLCTQSPRSVDYQAFGNCSTKLIGRLESTQDVDRVADWFTTEGPAPAWLNGRKGCDPGTFVARWPGLPAELDGQTWRSRCLFSAHEGAWSPEQVEGASRAAGAER